MSNFGFQHLFYLLMALAAASAMVLPDDYLAFTRGNLDALLAPVAVPARKLSALAADRFAPEEDRGYPIDAGKTPMQLREENNSLRATLSVMTEELARLRQEQADRRNVGDLADFTFAFDVLAADAGPREAVTVRATSGAGYKIGMPVLSRDNDLVGRIAAVGTTASQIRLVTDRESWMKVAIRRQEAMRDGTYSWTAVRTDHTPVLQGAGRDRMYIMNVDMKEVQAAGLAEGDWIVLNDETDWPRELQGRPLGRIEKIAPQSKTSWFAQITVRPRRPLMQLKSVMVIKR